MGEMKKFVVDDVPVQDLPDKVRRCIQGTVPVEVRVTVEFEVAAAQSPGPPRNLRSFIGTGRGLFETPEQATASIRELRDEWDD